MKMWAGVEIENVEIDLIGLCFNLTVRRTFSQRGISSSLDSGVLVKPINVVYGSTSVGVVVFF